MLELWKALDRDGVLSAAEARETLGRELTEAAVLRGLCELWQGLRISPVFAEPSLAEPGQPARWELLRVRHREALATASATSQVTALSLLVSMYLQSVYAASSEEIEIFLSPAASRSRVREAVRGLSATRQIHSLSMDAQTYYFLEDGLPEFGEPAASPAGRTDLRPAFGGSGEGRNSWAPLSPQHGDPSMLAKRRVGGANHLLSRRLDCRCRDLSEGPPVDCHRVAMQEPQLEKSLHHHAKPSRRKEIGRDEAPS